MPDPELTLPAVDRGALYMERVKGRKVIYLDTDLWGQLAEETRASVLRVERFERLVQADRVVFPVAFPSVSETLQHPHAEHRLRQLRVMDRLCRGVCLRLTDAVESDETFWALPAVFGAVRQAPGRESVFTHVIECAGSGQLNFPQGWNAETSAWFVQVMHKELRVYGLERLAQGMNLEKLRARHSRETETRMRERRGERAARRNAALFRRPDGKRDRERILLEEQVYFAKRALKRITETLVKAVKPHDLPRLAESLERLQVEPLGLAGLFRLMPSTALRAEVFAHRVYEAERNERPGDLFDNEHASVAPAYSDAFASGDGALVRLLRGCTVPRDRGCQVLMGLAELDGLLAPLLATVEH